MKNKKPLVLLLLLPLVAVLVMAYQPDSANFNTNQFSTSGGKIAIKNGVLSTNAQAWNTGAGNKAFLVSDAVGLSAGQNIFEVDDFLSNARLYVGGDGVTHFNVWTGGAGSMSGALSLNNVAYTASQLLGTDSGKVAVSLNVGSGLSLSGGTLSATGGGGDAFLAGFQNWTGSNSFNFININSSAGLTNASLTASTVLAADAQKKMVSVVNGSGALTNNNAGTLGWYNLFGALPSFQNWSGSNFFNFLVAGATGITNQGLTASTITKADANKKETSIANGTGSLTNDGSGNFGWFNSFLTAANLTGIATNGGTGTNNLLSSLTASVEVVTNLFTADNLTLTNGLTNTSWTASANLVTDANKRAVTLANGTGALTNNGSGVMGYFNSFITASSLNGINTNGGTGTGNMLTNPTFTGSIGATFTNNTQIGTSTIINGPLITVTRTNGPATALSSFDLTNSQVATSGNQFYSPQIHWAANGFKTAATAASQPVEYWITDVPIQGSSAPTGILVVSNSINNGTPVDLFEINSSGNVLVRGDELRIKPVGVGDTGNFVVESGSSSGLSDITFLPHGNGSQEWDFLTGYSAINYTNLALQYKGSSFFGYFDGGAGSLILKGQVVATNGFGTTVGLTNQTSASNSGVDVGSTAGTVIVYTNLLTTSYQIVTNAWAGGSSTLNMGIGDQEYVITANSTITGLIGLSTSRGQHVTLYVTNSTAADKTLTIPNSILTSDGARVYTVTNTSMRDFSFYYNPSSFTQMVSSPFF